MHTVQYQRWNPPQSPVRVEFPPSVFAELLHRGDEEVRGSLYGLLLGGEIRILAARPDSVVTPARGKKRDNPATGWERIGTFIRRAGGEVFLTETDLERFESQRAAVALVVAGNRAGFFVRQADGSIQTIRSHEEFSLTPGGDLEIEAVPSALPPPPPAVRRDLPPERPVKGKPHSRRDAERGEKAKTPSWPRAAAVLLAIPLAALAYFRPLSSAPVQLLVAESEGAVRISWNPAALPHGGKVEIADDGEAVTADVGSAQSNLTYAPRGPSLEVRMIADAGAGPKALDSATLALSAPPRPATRTVNADALREQIQTLEAKASELRESVSAGRVRLVRLQKLIDRLTHR